MVGQRVCCASSAIPLFLIGFARKRQVCQCGATVAQLICNQWVAGSIPVTGSMRVSGSVSCGTGPVSCICGYIRLPAVSLKAARYKIPPITYMQASSGSGVLNSSSIGASTSQQIEHPADNAKLLARLHIGVFPLTVSQRTFT